MNKIALLIFDLDDTLIHSNIDYGSMKKSILTFFENQGDSVSHLRIKDLLELLKSFPDKLQKAYEIIETLESEASKTAQPISDAEKIPDLLHETRLKAVILTNNSSKSIDQYLQNTQLQYLKEIGPIITRNDVSAMKPDPAGLIYIVNRFNVSKDEVLFIGDSYVDAEAALKAGIRFLLVNYRNLDKSAFSDYPPFQSFARLSDIFPFIRQLLIDCVF